MTKYRQGCSLIYPILTLTKSISFYRLLFLVFQISFSSVLKAATTPSFYDWTGFYFGIKTGASFSQFATNTSTQAGSALTMQQASLVNAIGQEHSDTAGFLAGIEGGYNWQFKQFLLGVETDLQSLSTNGLKYSLIPLDPTKQLVLTNYVDNNWLFTLRPRFGLITNNWLFYATSGLSLAFLRGDFLFTSNLGSFESQKLQRVKPGYAVGAGVETSLTPHVSLKTEYLFQDYNNTNASIMRESDQNFSNKMNMQSNSISLGVNYHIDDQLPNPLLTSTSFDINQWKTEIGTRLFFSSGLVGAPQPLLNSTSTGNILASRLTFSGLSATSEEIFARIDHSSGLFTKGYLGAGTISNGQLNDEDFPALDVYSNTLSNAWGNLSYATIDIGYTFLKNLLGSTGAFIGYNYYAQNINTSNCYQLAGDVVCVPSSELANFLALSEDDQFNSMRLGVTSEFKIAKKISVTSEAAYLPFIKFHGLDMHNARQLVGPEGANQGDGAMLEAILNYQLNDSWSMGLGGRYWTWNMHNGYIIFDFLGESNSTEEPGRFNAERYGVFLQVNYHNKQLNELQKENDLINWKGFFIGGSLGGSWSKSYWSDPFNSSIGVPGYVNVAGFGDQIHTSGPLGGLELQLNWQTGHLVYGVGASISGSDIRGTNTVFSGLGGVNGQEKINYIDLIIGRLGTTIDRALFYLNGGGAALNTQYGILSNTGALSLGAESQTSTTWGWVGGAGIAYALSNSWSTNIEYDYINIPNHLISLPSVALINEQQISEHQTINLFKVGIHYRLKDF